MTEHTPEPWSFDGGGCIEGPDKQIVACLRHDMCPELTVIESNEAEAIANAEFIVRACNCHDELLEALEGLLSIVDDCSNPAREWRGDIAFAKSAVAKAEAKP